MQTPLALVSPYNLSKFIETGVLHGDIKQHSVVHALHSSTARDRGSRGDTGTFGYPGSGAQAADGLLLQRRLARRPRGPDAASQWPLLPYSHALFSCQSAFGGWLRAIHRAKGCSLCPLRVTVGWPLAFFCLRRPAFQPALGRLCFSAVRRLSHLPVILGPHRLIARARIGLAALWAGPR